MKILINILVKVILVGIFIMIWVHFSIPVSVGIINVGDIIGLAFSAVGIFSVIFSSRLKNLIGRIWEHIAGRIFLVSTAVIGCIGVICAVVISVFMIRAMNDNPKGKPVTIVVLGCQINGETPSLMLKRRLDTAYNYLAEFDDVNVIVSGGQGSDEVTSEADVMKKYLLNKGIAENRIFMEDKSTNTLENIKFSKEIIENRGLEADIAIVTDGFHQLRGDIFAKRQGLKSYNISAKTEDWLLPTYWIREIFGVAYYLIFG